MGKTGFCIQNTNKDIGDLTLAKTDISSDYFSLNTKAYIDLSLTKTLSDITDAQYIDSHNTLLYTTETNAWTAALKPWGGTLINCTGYTLKNNETLKLVDKRSIVIPKKDATGQFLPVPCKYVYTASGYYYFKWLEQDVQTPGIYKVTSPTDTTSLELISTDFGLNIILQAGGAGGSGCIFSNSSDNVGYIHGGAGGGSGAIIFAYVDIKALTNGITIIIENQFGSGSESKLCPLSDTGIPSKAGRGNDIYVKNSATDSFILKAFGGESADFDRLMGNWSGGNGGNYWISEQASNYVHIYLSRNGKTGGSGKYLLRTKTRQITNDGTAGEAIAPILLTPFDISWPFDEKLELRTGYGQAYPINARTVSGDAFAYCSGGGGGGSSCGVLFSDHITVSGYGYGGAGAGSACQYWASSDTYDANYTAKGIDGGIGAFAICKSFTDWS